MLSAKLRTLLAVAELRNFTRAAEKLSLTQPAVSHHIAQLEEEFGCTLFLRGKGGLRPTPDGEIVIRYAHRMAALYDRLHTDLINTGKQVAKLKIGITHTSESNLTSEVLAKCSNETNGFRMTIITDTIKNLYTLLENYEIDLAIVEGNANNPAFSSLVLGTDFLVCVMSPEHPLAHSAMVTLSQLKQQALILRLPSSATRILFDSTLRSLNDSPDSYNISIEVNNIATIKDLVRKNLGVSVLPQSACMDELRKGKLIALPIENLSMVRETRLVYNKDFSHQDLLQRITRTYRETAESYR